MRFQWLGFALLWAFSQPQAVSASTVVAMSLPEIVKSSQLIFKGTVVKQKTRWNNGKIQTECVIAVEEWVRKGKQESKTVTILLNGGEYGDVGLKVVGEPQCGALGDRKIVAAVERKEKNTFRPVGMSQGWFDVKREKLNGRELVLPSNSGIRLIHNSAPGMPTTAQGGLKSPEPVRNFLDRLRHLAY